jgi:2-oxoisovalerate dehydrogenase E2 component (dihydrolipoyl transacylase)
MAITLRMPEVGETVTEGTIERWLKQPGDHIEKYEPIVEVNTDKVNVELPSPVTGTLAEIIAPEGATVAIGDAMATIDEVAGETPADVAPPEGKEEPVPAEAAPAKGARGGERRRATPRIRRLAEEMGVNLSDVAGTGPGGRVMEEDVRKAAERVAPTPEAAGAPPAQEEEDVALTAVRKTIARRMAESKFSAPHAWLVMEADVTGLVAHRKSTRQSFRDSQGFELTYLPFVVRAVARSLAQHPYLNASWAEDRIVLKKRVHVGIAVATEGGLLVPVVRDADRLDVTALARTIHDLTERARARKLKLDDVQGGTFTVDNTGAFGPMVSMPIVNLGQAAIISLEAITKRPVVVDRDAIAIRSVVNLCLSFDHRILDGAQAGVFLAEVKDHLEAITPESSLD